MQKLLVASIAGAAITTCNSLAFAADPGPRPIAKAPMTTVYDWTGLYVGGHVGWGSADRTFGQTNLSGNIVNPGFVQNPNGIIGGGQIGFNQQTGNFVWGLEIDISGASLRETTTAPVVFAPPLTETFNVSIDWTASLTARLGYAWDRWLVYGKGGAALMRETYALTAPGFFAPDSPFHDAKVTRLGWTAGAGIENAFLNNWSWKLEYNYMRFDGNDSIVNPLSITTTGSVSSHTAVDLHLVKAGVNYRFGNSVSAGRVQPAAYKAPIATAYNWTGLYAGGHVGWAGADRNFLNTFVAGGMFTPAFSQSSDGFTGGGQVGFNRQTGNWVLGFEADVSGANLRARSDVNNITASLPQTYDVKIDWMATLAGRVGYAWNRWMVYGKGGGAIMQETYALASPLYSSRADAHVTRMGWIVGAGIENAFLDSWSWKAEYNFMRFDNSKTIGNQGATSNATALAAETNADVHAVKLGINYRFGNSAVVAKY